jgi:hypothetical protein
MTAGDVTRVTATVRNLTDRPLRWLSDGCEIPVSVEGLSPMAWPKGETHRPQAQLFKDLALGRLFRTPPLPGPIADFVDPSELGRGSFGCGDIGIDHTIEPHATVESVQAWDGAAALRWGPFPSGPVTITASFAHFWRGATMPDVGTSAPLTATLDGWVIDGPGAGWLGPVGAVDAALRDPGFVTWLDGQDLRSGRDEIAWYRPALGLWEVGVLAWYDAPTPQMHLLHVDPYTGEVLATIDRQWDQRLDGFP